MQGRGKKVLYKQTKVRASSKKKKQANSPRSKTQRQGNMATSKCYRLTINNCVRVRVCVCAIFIVLLAWESCESMMRFDESRQRIMGNGVRGEWQSYRTECPLVELVVIVTASLWKSIYWCVGFLVQWGSCQRGAVAMVAAAARGRRARSVGAGPCGSHSVSTPACRHQTSLMIIISPSLRHQSNLPERWHL